MIIKLFELTKIKLNNYKFYLFYGDNEGLKEENIKKLFEKNYQDKIYNYLVLFWLIQTTLVSLNIRQFKNYFI